MPLQVLDRTFMQPELRAFGASRTEVPHAPASRPPESRPVEEVGEGSARALPRAGPCRPRALPRLPPARRRQGRPGHRGARPAPARRAILSRPRLRLRLLGGARAPRRRARGRRGAPRRAAEDLAAPRLSRRHLRRHGPRKAGGGGTPAGGECRPTRRGPLARLRRRLRGAAAPADLSRPLHACARFLLDAGADPDQKVGTRWPPASPEAPSEEHPLSVLYGAAGQNRDPALTRILLDAGAEPPGIPRHTGQAARDPAAKRGNRLEPVRGCRTTGSVRRELPGGIAVRAPAPSRSRERGRPGSERTPHSARPRRPPSNAFGVVSAPALTRRNAATGVPALTVQRNVLAGGCSRT